jgi:hypothetical protein
MDIEKLIEQLKRNTDCWTDKVHGYADLRLAAATALSTLQAENEKLRAELDEKEKYYDQMIDALAATDSAELEQVKRERDAAIESWRGFCAKCTWNGKQYLSDGKMDDRCKTCRDNNKCNWEWRGIKED